MIKPTTATLPSNLRLLVAPLPSSESVTVMILVRAGSRFETKSTNGISHFLEHMFFKGGERYPNSRAVSEAIDGIGGTFNAFTGREYVGYYVKVAKHHIETAFEVLSDMLLTARLDTDALKRESGVILEELRMYQDNPQSQAATHFDDLLFPDHPLGWDIIGTPENIQSFSRKHLKQYKDRLYSASNIVVTVAGGTTMAQVKKLTSQYLPYPTAVRQNKPRPYTGRLKNSAYRHVIKPTEQAHLIIGTTGVAGNHDDRATIDLLGAILGGGMSSRLFLNVREELGLAYYIHAYHQAFTDTGYFAVSAGVDKNRIQLAAGKIREELLSIAHHGVEVAELNKAKEQLIGNLLLELEHSDEVAYLFGVRWLLYGQSVSVEQITNKIRRVSPSDIQKMAKKLFIDQPQVFTVVGPKVLSDKIRKSYTAITSK